MSRLLVIVPFIVLALDVFAIVDVILVDARRVRAMPKVVWVILILLVPVVGAALWFFIGKERSGGSGQLRTVAPDDDPNFLKNIRRDEEQDERIRRLEQELADLDDDPPKD
ncbi:MAG: PLDc_N domain-containing protein [Salinibacterium sp.]|nr:PLDc_N domain-containing protein [Salinibacterium sp.]